MYRRGWPALLMMLAICSMGLAAGFSISDGSVHWFWADTPQVAVALVAASLACCCVLLLLRRRRT